MAESSMASAPAGQEAQDDPEIEALLDFEPVPRKRDVEGGWTPENQRQFIRRLAAHGSATRACDEMAKNQTGIMKLYRSPLGASFRAAWDGAVALAKRRRAEAERGQPVAPGTMPPTIDHRFKSPSPTGPLDLDGKARQPGQVMNERGKWEEEDSLRRRAEDARESITMKLLRARRLYLQEICGNPGKRAAFEILTELPIDWDKARRCEPQPDEPYHRVNMRKPDMLLTAENGWLAEATRGPGPNKKLELMKAVDKYRARKGMPPINWAEEQDGKST